MQAGKLRMCLAPANLVGVVTGVVAEQRLVHPRRVFSLELPECESVVVTVDADRIRQVLTNFLTNAVKYTPARKPIEIRLHVTDTMLRVSVRDQGPGLEPAQHEHVWKRFHQAQPLHQGGDVTGLGLGLYISRVIIEQHHGNVGLESVAGQGATFWFDIPLRLEEPRLKEYAQAQS